MAAANDTMRDSMFPPLGKAFAGLKDGRPPAYTPEQVAEEFDKYIEYCEQNPIRRVVTYKQERKRKHAADETEGEQAKQIQTRTETFPQAPCVSYFVQFWLGMDMVWWSFIGNKERNKEWQEFSNIKAKISTYCRNVKLQGARTGLYNGNIVARELGLTDKTQVTQDTRSVQIVVDNADDANEMRDLINGRISKE